MVRERYNAKWITHVALRQFGPEVIEHLVDTLGSLFMFNLRKFVVATQVNRKPDKHAGRRRNKADESLVGFEPLLFIHDKASHPGNGPFISGNPPDVRREGERLIEFEVEDGFK